MIGSVSICMYIYMHMHVCMGNDVYVCVSILRIFVNILTKMNVRVHPLKFSMDTPPPPKKKMRIRYPESPLT